MGKVRHVSDLKTVTSTDTGNPDVIYPVPETRRVVIKKIMLYNKDGAANTVAILDGSTQKLPAITVDANGSKIIGELDLPAAEFYSSINAVLGTAPTNGVDVVVEVEEEGA